MTILEKVAYLRGLSEGLGIDDSSKEGRMLKAIVDVLDDLALTVTDLEDDVAEISDCLDEIDEDLSELEEEVYGSYEDYDDEPFDDDDVYYEVTCGKCGDLIRAGKPTGCVIRDTDVYLQYYREYQESLKK